MKKLLLLSIILFPLLLSAQKLIRPVSYAPHRFYDAAIKSYVTREDFITKHGEPKFVNLVQQSLMRKEIEKEFVPSFLGKDYMVSNEGIITKISAKRSTTTAEIIASTKDSLVQYSSIQVRNPSSRPYKYRLRASTTIAGGALIGGSFAIYAINNASLDSKIRDYSYKITKVSSNYSSQISTLDDKLRRGLISQTNYNKEMAAINANIASDTNDLESKMKSADKKKKNPAYICGAISIAGVVAIIAGIYKDYDNGIPVAHNAYINSTNNGLSASIVF